MSLEASNFYYGKGRFSIAVRNPITKALGPWVWCGDVSAFSAKPTTTMVEHKESYSGQSALAAYFPSEKALTLDWTFSEFRPKNLAFALYGTNISVESGTATDEVLAPGLAVGDDVRTANPGISDLVLTDSAAVPAELVEGTDYTVDPTFGRITILNIGAYVQPFKANYSYAQRTDTGIFTAGQPDISVLYEGINLAENNAAVIAEYYKVAPGVLTELMHITTGTDTAGMAMTAGVLIDTTKPASGPLGQFGRVTQVGVAA
ncbi:phage tail tube protein [Rhodanobacter sp. BL-MT-08]